MLFAHDITVDVTPEAKEPKEPKQGSGGAGNIKGHLLQLLNRRPAKQYLVEKGIYKGMHPIHECNFHV